ncbi:MAG: hypothetical protein Q8R23_03985 [Methylotenera sp.]|nr:hypothetical protein [Methylotenera sp.]
MTLGEVVTAVASVKEATSNGSGCVAGDGSNVPEGAGTIDIDRKGFKVQADNTYFTCSDNGTGAKTSIVNNGSAPTASADFATAGLTAPALFGVVADYSGTSAYKNSNVCIDLQVKPVAVTGCSCDGLDPNVYVFADQASAEGTSPGDNFQGSFQIRVKNCLGHFQENVKVQGGAVAWVTSEVDTAVGAGNEVTVSAKKKNNVFTWNTDLAAEGAGQCKYIEIDETGRVDAKAIPGTVYYMSGPWSAAWYDEGNHKSEYTGRVSFTVTP